MPRTASSRASARKRSAPTDGAADEAKVNLLYSQTLSKKLEALQQGIRNPLDDPALQRHLARGKLFVRERISRLLDLGSPFLEIAALAGHEVYPGVRSGAGLVCGIGRVSQREVMIVANDATVKGGTYFPLSIKKHLRAQQIALENRLPCIYLVDSGGVFLPMQEQVFPDREHFGRIFYNQARMSSLGIAQISAVMGSCTAGGAYVPAMSDEVVMVRNQATIFLGGPPLVKAATGEEISAEELGGARVHCEKSGVADHLAESEQHALELVRRIVSRLPAQISQLASRPVIAPRHAISDLYQLLPADPKKYFPMRDVLQRLIDGSEFDEFKALYGSSLICGFAHIQGQPVGIVANDGILFPESALKGTHFIQLCDKRRIPLLFLQNISGFMVGRDSEHRGIAKDGAKMVAAVSCCSVPKIGLIVGGSYGAGNYAMAGRAYDPRFLFSWPNARIAVMGAQQAADVLLQVRAESAQKNSATTSKKSSRAPSSQELAQYRANLLDHYEQHSSAFYASSQLWDDGVIDPIDTREVLGLALHIVSLAPWPAPPSISYRF
jgi:3-methylcrotonyl-CoA carboxylase beta subunit